MEKAFMGASFSGVGLDLKLEGRKTSRLLRKESFLR